MNVVKSGDKVNLTFEGKLKDGQIFYKNDGEHTSIVIGKNQVFPALEKEIIGMKIGETKTVSLEPKDAFGERNDDLIMSISKQHMDADTDLSKGNMLKMELADGKKIKGIILNTSDEEITVDFNHPLAGKKIMITCTIHAIETENQ